MTIIKFAREAARFGRTYKKVDIEVPASRERRQTERAVAYWGEKLDALGDMATIAALDLDKFTSTDWSNRFLIAVDERLEYSMLMMYGTEFARLLEHSRIGWNR
jgi:hypothetical protein